MTLDAEAKLQPVTVQSDPRPTGTMLFAGSTITLLVLSIPLFVTSSWYLLQLFLRLLGWHLLRQSEPRREIILTELEVSHGGKVKKAEATLVGFFHPFWWVLWPYIALAMATLHY